VFAFVACLVVCVLMWLYASVFQSSRVLCVGEDTRLCCVGRGDTSVCVCVGEWWGVRLGVCCVCVGVILACEFCVCVVGGTG